MRTDNGELLERMGDTYIITGDIYCNSHTNTAARSAAGCAIQVNEVVLHVCVSLWQWDAQAVRSDAGVSPHPNP